MLFPQDLAHLLAQYSGTVLIVADPAKSPIHAASTRAEPMPPLSPYKRTMKAKRATRRGHRIHSNNNNNALSPSSSSFLESPPSSPHYCVISKKRVLQLQAKLIVPACRWTAQETTTLLPCIPKPPLHDEAPRKPGSWRFSHKEEEDDPHSPMAKTDQDSLTSLLTRSPPPGAHRRTLFSKDNNNNNSSTTSPRMPRRKASFRLGKHDDINKVDFSTSISSSSSPPRLPQRRSIDTAHILQEALDSLRLCDLGRPEDQDNDDQDNDNDDLDNDNDDHHNNKESKSVEEKLPQHGGTTLCALSSRQ